jgi:lipid II:glycine glycyltransferase (peptidoglycan interpeptide bridge formation enzyme)
VDEARSSARALNTDDTTTVRIVDDAERWNALLRRLPAADVRQGWEWGELLRTLGWRPLRVAAYAGDAPVAALSALIRRVPGVGALAYAPRGPVLDPSSAAAWTALPPLAQLVRRRSGAAFLRASPPAAEADAAWAPLQSAGFHPVPELWSVWNTPRNVMLLDLDGTEQELLGRMARKRRQHVSTAGKKGISVTVDPTLPALRALYTMLVDHASRQAYNVPGWSYFEALHRLYAPAGGLAVLLGFVRGELAGAAVGVRFGAMAHLRYHATTPAGRSTSVGDLLHWEWIRWAKAAGCRTIDFGSSCTDIPPTETHPGYGIYRFKLELGARLVMYRQYHDRVFAPMTYRLARWLERSGLRTAWRLRARVQHALTARPAAARRAAA